MVTPWIRDESRIHNRSTHGRFAIHRVSITVQRTANLRPASEDDWLIRDKSRIYGHHRTTTVDTRFIAYP